MKNVFFLLIIFLHSAFGFSQVFDVETIKFSGDNDKRINLVILSEGYQNSELDQFITDATNFTNNMFNQSPFSEYTNYFNVYAIKVPSNESGADHPKTGDIEDEIEWPIPTMTKDTYFNASYDSFESHFLLFYEIDVDTSNDTETIINTVLANNFPTYDQALIIVNSPYYGGSGGKFPMTSTGVRSYEIVIHELGHSLFDLKDEYYPIFDTLVAEAINMTQETNPSLVKWKNWMGINNIGIHQHSGTAEALNWYKPQSGNKCKMEKLNEPFCSVCKEGMVEKIHDLISPIDSYTPVSSSITNPSFPINFQLDLIEPIPNTLESEWILNATNFTSNVDTIDILETDLNAGTNHLTVSVHDNSPLLKVDNHDTLHISTITWTIENASLGIKDITSEVNNLSISIYPNPSKAFINLKVESKKDVKLKVELVSLDGKKVKSIKLSNFENNQLDISQLSQGVYTANFYSNNALITSKKIIKI